LSGPAPERQGFVPGRHLIDAYGAGGFRFAGMSHVGSILATPLGVQAVSALTPDEINASLLEPLFSELAAQPRSIEFLIVGTGERMARLSDSLRARLRQAGLRTDTMATGPASRVYNIMLSENRRVAALLLAAP
jgi:uncharacterized protein